MDRHVKWLRRRILASIATQTAEVFAVVAVLAFALMYWQASEGPVTSLFGAVVIAQLVAGARIGHAMRNNPLNYVFMRKYVDRPFTYRVSRFQGEDEAHPVASRLPGFAPVATIRDTEADPEPVFDIYHDPSRLVAASVSRASGSVALISSLEDGRIMVTDARALPPHERLVMNLTAEDTLESVITTHRRAISARSDVVELASSAHQVVLDSLTIEYDAYLALGPALSPFLDLEASGRSFLRLTARIKPAELAELPVRLGPDLPPPTTRPLPPEPPTATAPAVPQIVAPQVDAPQVVAPQVDAPEVVAPQVVAPQVVAPQVDALVATVDVTPVHVVAVEVAPLVIPPLVINAPEIATQSTPAPMVDAVPDQELAEIPVEPIPAARIVDVATVRSPIADVPVAVPAAAAADPVAAVPIVAAVPQIGPSPFVTLEPETEPIDSHREPITQEVPAVVFTQTPVATQAPVSTRLPVPAVPAPAAVSGSRVLDSLPTMPTIDVSLADAVVVPAVVAAPPAVVGAPPVVTVAPPAVAAPPAVVADPSVVVAAPPAVVADPSVVTVAPPVVADPSVVTVAPPVVAAPPAVVADPSVVTVAPSVVAPVAQPAATLAEAVQTAPDTAAALTNDFRVLASAGVSAGSDAAHAASVEVNPVHAVAVGSAAAHAASVEEVPAHVGVPDLATALGYSSPTSKPLPRLSAVLRAHAPGAATPPQKRSRRKAR